MGRHNARMKRIEAAIQPEPEFKGPGALVVLVEGEGWREDQGSRYFTTEDLNALEDAGAFVIRVVAASTGVLLARVPKAAAYCP